MHLVPKFAERHLTLSSSDATEPTEIDVDDREQAWQMERGGEFGVRSLHLFIHKLIWEIQWATEDDTLAHDSTISFICPYGEGADATYRFTGECRCLSLLDPLSDHETIRCKCNNFVRAAIRRYTCVQCATRRHNVQHRRVSFWLAPWFNTSIFPRRVGTLQVILLIIQQL